MRDSPRASYPILRDGFNADAARASNEHLQRCIMALEKIIGIDDGGVIGHIARRAIENKAWDNG